MKSSFIADQRIQDDGATAVMVLRGRISELEAHVLEKEILRCLDQGVRRLVLDLSDVSYVTSATLGALMVAHKRTRASGGGVRVVNPQPLVRQVLDITKLSRLFGIYDSVTEALASN